MRGRKRAIAALAVAAALGAAPVSPAATATAATAARRQCDTKPIQTALDALKNIGVPGIAVTVKSPECGVWNGGVGLADRATGRKVVGTEYSRIGSDTKTWTATVVLQLVGEGKIKLDDTVERYLPGLIRNAKYDGRKITVRQLLNHTSGLPDYLDAEFWKNEETHRFDHIEPLFTVKQALCLDPPDDRAPSGYAYANTNYNLAGLIVAKVTGRDIGTEITERIIKPLGLRETYWPGDDVTIRKPELRSYKLRGNELVDRTEWNTTESDASGELISTGADATAFWVALLTGKLLAPAQLAEMKKTVLDNYGEGYGLGIERYEFTEGLVTWGHSGGMPSGHEFRNAVTEDGRRSATFLIDTDEYESDDVDAIIGDLIRDLR